MKNTIIIIAVAVFAIGLLAWRGGGVSGTDQTAVLTTGVTSANLADSIPSYDFGSISMLRGNVEHEFAIKNTTNEDLAIQRAETSCMCTRVVLILPDGKELGPFGMAGHGFNPSVDATIPAGETFTVRAIYDPAAHGPAGIGRVERDVTVTTSNGPITMRFKAQVTP